MGSGKARLIAAICASGRGRVLVTVPTIALVRQLSATIEEHCPGEVGTYWTESKETQKRITVACLPSVSTLVTDPTWPGPPSLVIADECHREGDSLREAYDLLRPDRAIGFSATPFRASEKDELALWDREIFSYGVQDALRDGVIVPFRQVPWEGGEDTPLDEACLTLIRRNAHGPGICNARNIEDAEKFVNYLTDNGIKAGVIHSRMPNGSGAATLERLRTGEISTVVHVNMLSEGVDLPWLRWLLMRRPVGSRVRFCQEVGRTLRAYPGKHEAVLLDPHDLLGRFILSYEAVLNGMADAKPEEDDPFGNELEAIEKQKDTENSQGQRQLSEIHPTTLAAWRKYLRAVTLTAMAKGLIECKVKSTRWRPYPASEKQVSAVSRSLGSTLRDTTIPLAHRKQLSSIAEHVQLLTKGDASDLLGLLFLFKDGRRDKRDVWRVLTATDTETD